MAKSNLPDGSSGQGIAGSGAAGTGRPRPARGSEGTGFESALVRAQDVLEQRMGGFAGIHRSLGEAPANPVSELSNIIGWGIGEKVRRGGYTGDLAVKVYVVQKADPSRVKAHALVPDEVEGYPTDVEEVGEVSALRFTGRYRPAPGGSSIGHPAVTAGTLGALVVRGNQHLCVLSNNHVLADCNRARPGDPVLQPGAYDGGTDPRDRVGVLESFVPVQFGGAAANVVDAAVAWTNLGVCSPAQHLYTIRPNPVSAQLGMTVRKCGRTTEGTLGVVVAVNVSIRINYGASGIALFRGQMQIRGVGGDFSQGGDSGSLVVTAGNREPVGLLFAGGGGLTFANPIGAVMGALGISRFYV